MRFKAVPAPPSDLADVSTVRDALPRVPRSEADCCARLARRVDWIDDRDAGREWLLFLRAAGLATRTAEGDYVRSTPTGEHDGSAHGSVESASGNGESVSENGESSRESAEPTSEQAESVGERTEPASERTESASDDDQLRAVVADALRNDVVGASAVLSAIDDEPCDVDDAFDAVRPAIPEWERRRSHDWEAVWRERVEALLQWWTLLGAARRTESGYVRCAP